LIRPTKDALSNFALRVGNPANIALAAPLHAVNGAQNSGHGVVSPITMLNTTHVDTPIQIRFDAQDNTKYRVFNITTGLQIGPVRTFVPGENIFPVPSPTYDPGYRLSISGTPGLGDIFTITANNAINGDSTNGLALAALQTANILEGGTSTLNSTYGQLYAMMGSLASQADTNQSAAVSLNRAAQNLRDQISGVNLDEEAGNLVQLQQLYQAAAKVISVAQETFYALIKAIG
jgi:flagellar hook-associated protein 1 FlgK